MEIPLHVDIAKIDIIGLLSLEFPWMKLERIEHIAQKIIDDVFTLALQEVLDQLWAEDEKKDKMDIHLADINKDIHDLKKVVLDLSKRLDKVGHYAGLPYPHHATSAHFNDNSNGMSNPWHDYGKKS